MGGTDPKLVHWALDITASDLMSEATSDSISSTSTLQYINSQLIAHGFVRSPGICLDGLSDGEVERVVKCLLGMLSQRVEDMSRAEDVSAKLRTLSYDHDRLLTMHRSAIEKAAGAEREMNVFKSRLLSSIRSLQSSENAHKHTTAELQRTRTMLQALRVAHQVEIKKKEKENERMAEKWIKLSDAQKLSRTSSSISIRVANADVVTGSEILGKGKGYHEVALEQAESLRARLADGNINLQRLLLKAVNEMQAVLQMMQSIFSNGHDEITPLTLAALFPLNPPTAPHDIVSSLLTSLHEALSTLSLNINEHKSSPVPVEDTKTSTHEAEISRLQDVIETLRSEIEDNRRQHEAHSAETRAMFERFAEQAIGQKEAADLSVDLMTGPVKDEEEQKLHNIREELNEERRKFTEAAIKLGKEKAMLETERINFLEEKRAWQVGIMLAELPPTPVPASASSTFPSSEAASVNLNKSKSPRKSPRKSSIKAAAAGKGGSRKVRVSRRSSILPLLSPDRKIDPAYETEVIPAPVLNGINKGMSQSILPTSFVLPPPSPHTSMPPSQTLLSTAVIPLAPFEIPTQQPSSESDQGPLPLVSSTTTPPTTTTVLPNPSPRTPSAPIHRPFPMAKPLMQHMIHAYSPAKPSPLSRILMLSDSPETHESELASPSAEIFEDAEALPTPVAPLGHNAQESGDEIPLRERPLTPNITEQALFDDAMAEFKHRNRDSKRFTAQEKGKEKAHPTKRPPAGSQTRLTGTVEKENSVKRIAAKTSTRTFASKSRAAESRPLKVTAKSSTVKTASKLPSGKGGARRVPIDSAEAAPVLTRKS